MEIEHSISIEKAAWLVDTTISSMERLAREKVVKSHRDKFASGFRFFESDIRKAFKLNK